MKSALLLASILALGLIAACAQKTDAPASPEQAAAKFYARRMELKIQGLPDEKQLAALTPHLTPGLRELFVEAAAEQKEFMRKHPDEKPPWIEGDLFSSLFEGVSAHKISTASTTGDRAEVRVDLTYTWRGDTSRWHDVIVLRNQSGRWLVDDVLLKGEWAFKMGGSLRGILTAKE